MRSPSAVDLLVAMARLPLGIEVRFGNERDDRDGHEWFDVWQAAPAGDNGDGGWPVPPAHPADRYADRVLFSIATETHEQMIRLLFLALRERWP